MQHLVYDLIQYIYIVILSDRTPKMAKQSRLHHRISNDIFEALSPPSSLLVLLLVCLTLNSNKTHIVAPPKHSAPRVFVHTFSFHSSLDPNKSQSRRRRLCSILRRNKADALNPHSFCVYILFDLTEIKSKWKIVSAHHSSTHNSGNTRSATNAPSMRNAMTLGDLIFHSCRSCRLIIPGNLLRKNCARIWEKVGREENVSGGGGG